MPPVLYVSLDVLAACGKQEMFARQRRRGIHESQRILELIPEPECAPRLIEAGTTPHAAAQALVQQPAIEKEIHGGLWRFDLNRFQLPIPPAHGGLEGLFYNIAFAEGPHQTLGLLQRTSHAQYTNNFFHLIRRQLKLHTDRPAGIHSRPSRACQADAAHGGRLAQVSVPPQEFDPAGSVVRCSWT